MLPINLGEAREQCQTVLATLGRVGAVDKLFNCLWITRRGSLMSSVMDVAEFILSNTGKLSAMKLQKLTYYSQAWHLVWEEEKLFPEQIEAWSYGPVAPKLYEAHKGEFSVLPKTLGGDSSTLSRRAKSSVKAVLGVYGKMSAYELSQLTHQESPWKNAREGVATGARSTAVITEASMAEYYSSLV